MMHHALWSEAWTAALINHLWQSTLFVLIAWVFTLSLKNNQARTRYWIWMIASVKFLIPFSILIGAGEFLRTLFGAQVQSSVLTSTLEQVARPFPQTSSAANMIFNKAPILAAPLAHPHSLFLPAVWLCGFLAFVILWARSWIRVRSAVRSSTRAGLLGKVPILISRQLLEPAAFGIFRPSLMLSEAIKDHLSESQLNAIIAHELCHIGRRDNLSMAIHMIVQAAFWFHPAVWWIKARLIDERERACDEEVLQSGTDAHLYAESILKVCRFCVVESPLACVSGVSRSDLKQRIGRIMTGQIAQKLDFTRKLVLSMVGTALFATPVMLGLAHVVQAHAQVATDNPARDIAGKKSISETPPHAKSDEAPAPDKAYVPTMTFDVASVRKSTIGPGGSFPSGDFSPPNSSHVRLMNYPLKFLVAVWAYGVPFHEIEGMSKELEMTEFDVEAKSDRATDERLANLTKEQVRLEHKHMFQALLEERFKLKARWETRNGASYDLVVAKAGKLKSTGAPPSAEELKYLGDRPIPRLYTPNMDFAPHPFGGAMYIGHGATIADIVQILSAKFERPVVDKTGLTGKYDFTIKLHREQLSDNKIGDLWPPLEKAIQDELGLKLAPSRGPVRKLIVDHVEMPSEN